MNTFDTHAYDLPADHRAIHMDLELVEMPAAQLAGSNGCAGTVGSLGTLGGTLGTAGTFGCSGCGGGSADDLSF